MNGRFNREIPEEMQSTIKVCATGLGGVGIWGGSVGAGADLPAIALTWVGMTVTLAGQANHSLDRQTAKKITLAVATGVGSLIGGAKVASTVFGWAAAFFTGGISVAVSIAANVALNSSITYAYGRAVSRYFLTTDYIEDVEVMVQTILALMGEDLGMW